MRNYYLNESRVQGWSVRVLERNIQTSYFERLLSSQKTELLATNKESALMKIAKLDLIKDPYVLEFLNLPENPTPKETDLESAIISHIY